MILLILIIIIRQEHSKIEVVWKTCNPAERTGHGKFMADMITVQSNSKTAHLKIGMYNNTCCNLKPRVC